MGAATPVAQPEPFPPFFWMRPGFVMPPFPQPPSPPIFVSGANGVGPNGDGGNIVVSRSGGGVTVTGANGV